MAEVRWTDQASEDLASHAKYIAQDSPHYASLFVMDAFDAVERLERFPQIGRVVPEKNDPAVREIVLGNYRIVYRVRSEWVELLTIHHGAQLLDPTSLDESCQPPAGP